MRYINIIDDVHEFAAVSTAAAAAWCVFIFLLLVTFSYPRAHFLGVNGRQTIFTQYIIVILHKVYTPCMCVRSDVNSLILQAKI